MRVGRPIDPELAAMATLVPHLDLSDPTSAREIEQAITGEILTPTRARDFDVVKVRRADGSKLELAVHEPHNIDGHARPSPVLLFLHGGSFITGGLHSEIERCAFYADGANCTVVSVDYRLAPEHPYPAALEDCFTALEWIGESIPERNLDPGRVAIGGLSAGGGLAAAMALRLMVSEPGGAQRDWSPTVGPHSRSLRVVLQLLLFPVLDSSLQTHSARAFDDTPVLTASMLPVLWRQYLGGRDKVSPWSSPSSASDLSGSAPAFIATAQFDPLRDEALDYARRLLECDVPVDLRQYGRSYHSFDSFHTTRLGRMARQHQIEALRAAFR